MYVLRLTRPALRKGDPPIVSYLTVEACDVLGETGWPQEAATFTGEQEAGPIARKIQARSWLGAAVELVLLASIPIPVRGVTPDDAWSD